MAIGTPRLWWLPPDWPRPASHRAGKTAGLGRGRDPASDPVDVVASGGGARRWAAGQAASGAAGRGRVVVDLRGVQVESRRPGAAGATAAMMRRRTSGQETGSCPAGLFHTAKVAGRSRANRSILAAWWASLCSKAVSGVRL